MGAVLEACKVDNSLREFALLQCLSRPLMFCGHTLADESVYVLICDLLSIN
jgi:hypothetical protein